MAADYWRSSQANQWLLTPLDLRLARVEDVRYAGSEDKVTAAIIFLANGISQLAKRLHFRQRITATATVFFHRFYVIPPNGLCNTDPCLVATACLYVASKVEETPLHIRSVHHEAAKMWQEYGHSGFPTSSTELAEMEFYLLRDLGYHLVLHHPYRALINIVGSVGKSALAKAESDAKARGKTGNVTNQLVAGLGLQAETLGVGTSKMGGPRFDMAAIPQSDADSFVSGRNGSSSATTAADQGQSEDELFRQAMTAGDHGLPVARAEELDQDVVQMAWFLLNDTYRHPEMHLLYPPYILAVAAIYLALVLHEKSREKLLASTQRMQERRHKWEDEQTTNWESNRAKRAKIDEASDRRQSATTSQDGRCSSASSYEATQSQQAPIQELTGLYSKSGTMTGSPSTTASSCFDAMGLPTRPSHLPLRPGSSTPMLEGVHSPRTARRSAVKSFLRSPPPVGEVSSGIGSLSAALAAGGSRGSAGSADGVKGQGPTPPPDILTFLAALNLAPTSQLAACIQSMLDGYATWASCQREIEGIEGSKRILSWLEDWRKKREEELRVLELEQARDKS